MPSNNNGVIYVASGKRHFEEAMLSISSVRSCMPSIPVTLFTDQLLANSDPLIRIEPLAPNEIRRDFCAKILPMIRSPYEKTLFLDTDTYMCSSCEELFPMLDRFDIMAVPDPWRCDYAFETVPLSFPTFNSGVIAFRRSEATENFFKDWMRNHDEIFSNKMRAQEDQPAFRHTLYYSDLKLFPLTPEFNLRTYYPCFVGGHSKVRIIHDRHPFIPQMARELNRSSRPRIYGPLSVRLVAFYYASKAFKVSKRILSGFIR